MKAHGVILALFALLGACGVRQTNAQADGMTSIGYPSIAAALQALRARSDVKFSEPDGWIIAIDEANDTVWSFPSKDNPAYPAAVKRQVIPADDGSIGIRTSISCAATKSACDKLAQYFREMNDKMSR